MLRIIYFLITSLLVLPINAEEIDLINKSILKIADSSASKEGDKMQFEVLSMNHGYLCLLWQRDLTAYQDYTITKNRSQNYLSKKVKSNDGACEMQDNFQIFFPNKLG
ncbi:hypothetical protein LEP1GSC077_0975 [Leptospira interrogans str. C10069]|uniref:Uncharacterized protein n=1 Tax=Leptospira interrogans serovar Pyrogenes str. 200701872 TaxID=1193029 RepID=M6ZSB5_LEPIR|nr:hypothetical protein LEP1GSC077_0975 [Leptospira interrogans str. C10069]EMP09358.1 hypothetical protein LEP1GSC124_4642 [Leptospira interrogans serovar Pyrogenes str. 200701872]